MSKPACRFASRDASALRRARWATPLCPPGGVFSFAGLCGRRHRLRARARHWAAAPRPPQARRGPRHCGCEECLSKRVFNSPHLACARFSEWRAYTFLRRYNDDRCPFLTLLVSPRVFASPRCPPRARRLGPQLPRHPHSRLPLLLAQPAPRRPGRRLRLRPRVELTCR